jgi:hypothetical protein
MVIMITVNLKSSDLYITALKNLAEFVREMHSFLILANGRGMISVDTFEENLSFLRRKLNSCDKLPQGFVKDQLSLLNNTK